MPGPRLRMCRMNNLAPRESEPVYSSKRKTSPGNWFFPLKAESFLETGSIWCWKTSGGWGLYVRNSTQFYERARNVCLSSRGCPALRGGIRSSTNASLTWAKLQVILLGEDRLGVKGQTLLSGLRCRGRAGRDGLRHFRGDPVGKAAPCLTPSGFECGFVATGDEGYRTFSVSCCLG